MVSVNGPASGDSLPHIADLLTGAFQDLRSALYAGSPPGLRPAHYRVMWLVPGEGIRLTDLAERAGITKAGVGQFMKYLEREGYVGVSPDLTDRRAKIVTLTPAGSAAVERSGRIIEDTEKRWSQALGAERYRELRRALFEIASLPPETGQPPTTPAG
jgi:DNA-binding MarR family transcriptional regulator